MTTEEGGHPASDNTDLRAAQSGDAQMGLWTVNFLV
jgi:hypothetical protein